MCVSVVSHISLANPDPHFSPSDTCNNSTKGCCNLNCLQCFEILRLKRGKSKVFTLCVPKLLHQAGLGSLEQEDIAARVLWFSGNSGLKVLFAEARTNPSTSFVLGLVNFFYSGRLSQGSHVAQTGLRLCVCSRGWP